jgi:hypothetical protein
MRVRGSSRWQISYTPEFGTFSPGENGQSDAWDACCASRRIEYLVGKPALAHCEELQPLGMRRIWSTVVHRPSYCVNGLCSAFVSRSRVLAVAGLEVKAEESFQCFL